MWSLFDKRLFRIFCVVPMVVFSAAELSHGQETATLVRVDGVKIEPLVRTVPVTGRLVARRSGTVAARIDGPLKSVLVEIGDRVDEHQAVALLDDTLLKAQQTLTVARVAEAQATLDTRKAELGLARLEAKRLKRLKDTAATTKAAYDDAVQGEVIAQAEVKEAQAALTSAVANRAIADINLRNTNIQAPYGGVITQRLVEAGAYVRVGDDVLRIIADQSLEVEADVPFERLGGLIPGTELIMVLDDGTSHTVRVRTVIPQESNLTRTRAVRFVPTFEETSTPLAANQSATVHIPTAAPRDVLSVHKDAVIKRGDQSIVYVITNDVAELRSVILGEALIDRFEVLDGLQQGDLAVVRGNERLRPGQEVSLDTSS